MACPSQSVFHPLLFFLSQRQPLYLPSSPPLHLVSFLFPSVLVFLAVSLFLYCTVFSVLSPPFCQNFIWEKAGEMKFRPWYMDEMPSLARRNDFLAPSSSPGRTGVLLI
jgi:hypothetical protein